jgi:sulfur-oxidizing protein SoxY
MSVRHAPVAAPSTDARAHPKRRRLLQGAGALLAIACVPLRAGAAPLPAIPALTAWLAGRIPRDGRVRLELPALADNGFAVPMRIVVPGPFAPGPTVRALRVFSETNPVPDLAVFEYPVPVERVEVDARIRLAGSQQIVAIAEFSDGTLFAAAAEVIVTLAGCMDGT